MAILGHRVSNFDRAGLSIQATINATTTKARARPFNDITPVMQNVQRPLDLAGSRPGSRPTSFGAKRSRQEKAPPEIAPRCAGSPCRRRPERGAAKLATLRFAQTDAAPFPAPGIAVTAQSTGVKSNGNGNGKDNCNCNCNCNCRPRHVQAPSNTCLIELDPEHRIPNALSGIFPSLQHR